jgi:excinuclease ABC subunit C
LRIRTAGAGDDFAGIREAVWRRYEHRGENELVPELLLIDGGKGQLHAALAALAGCQARPATVVALAKREELLLVAGDDQPLRLSRHHPGLRLLQYVRDEAHRFAQHYHRILRRRSTLGDGGG